MNYSVIIPALNEEGGIGSVLDRLHKLSPKPPEIIVIDDGSTDKTGDIARSKGATVLRHPQPGGYGRSLKDGMKIATHDIIAVTDADGTYQLEAIPELLKKIEAGYDMAVGARHGKHYRGSFLKMPARIVFKWLVEFTTGTRIPDINSGLRVFRKSQALQYENDLCNGFSFTTTITLIYLLTGKFVAYLPIDYGARMGRSKVRIIRDTLRTLQYITEVIVTYNPLKLFVLMSSILGLLAILSVIEFFIMPDPLFLLLTSLFLVGSAIIFGMGLLAHIRMKVK
jgi:glycosyltransferase involved in cell wall biosynthesis